MKTNQAKQIKWVATVAAALLLAGCGTTAGYKQAEKTGASIAEMRTEIVSSQKAIDQTMLALEQVAATANANPRKAFEQYAKSLDNLKSAADKARKRGEEMKARGQAYFKQWEQELAEVKNPAIRQLAEQRRAKLQAAFDSIQQYAEPLKEKFDPWLSDLKDLRSYLSNDLTIGGVDAAKSLFAKTQTEGVEVQKSMDALVGELNTVAAALTPAKVEEKK
jgi:hypothetical protein